MLNVRREIGRYFSEYFFFLIGSKLIINASNRLTNEIATKNITQKNKIDFSFDSKNTYVFFKSFDTESNEAITLTTAIINPSVAQRNRNGLGDDFGSWLSKSFNKSFNLSRIKMA